MKKIAYSLMAMAIAAFTFTSCEDVPAPFGQPTDPGSGEGGDVVVIEPSGSGTEADPYNVAAAIEIAKAMSADDAAKQVVACGYITSIDDIDTEGTYGNATYYISDDKDGKANKLEIYRGYGLNGQKFNAAGATIIKEGDFVVVSGGLVNFKGSTLEFTQGSKILSINGQGGGGTPSTETIGTKDDPITVAKALELTNALADNAESGEAFVKGKISKVQSYNSTYKSITYYISDDGTENNELQVYSGKGLNGADFASETDLAAGDVVIVKGKLKKYVNSKTGAITLEINQSSEIVSIVKGSGGGGGGTEASLGTADKPLTVAKALEIVNALADNGETETEAFVKGKISKVQSFSDKYKSITYYISDDGTENNELQIYSGKGLNGAEFAAAEDLSAGDVVIVKGKLKKYVNSKTGATTLEMNQPNEIVSITKASGGGGGGSDASEITAVFGELGISGDLSVVTLSDGTKLTFAQGGGKNPPIYHASTSIIRMYAQNEVTIDAGSKKISKVVFAYDTYNGTAYKGNDEMYGQAGNTKITPTKDDANVTFSGVNSSTLKVVNDFTSNSGGTQFRITGVTIIYAQ